MRKKKLSAYLTGEELLKGYGLLNQNKEKGKNGAKRHVYLRGNQTKSGKISLFLDYCKDGRRTKEYLGLVLNLETNDEIKSQNQETFREASTIASEKNNLLQRDEAGFKLETANKKDVLSYIDSLADKRLEKTGNKKSMFNSLKSLRYHLEQYKGDKITFKHIDKNFILNFFIYLQTARNLTIKPKADKDGKPIEPPTLKPNTQNKLSFLLNLTLKEAKRDEIIKDNPFDLIRKDERPKKEADTRTYLTLKEVQRLIKTECSHEVIKKAFLFCCFQGLRYSDVRKAKWGDLGRDEAGGITIHYKAQKTGKADDLPISEPALNYLPNRGNKKDDDLIYDLPVSSSLNKHLKTWIASAGIDKEVTWHVSRHTCATLLLSLGVPIETVSKILQHSNISTTQIYAKVLHEQERKAMDKLNGLFHS